MDLNLALESLLGFVVVGTGAAIAFAKLQARANENAKQLEMLAKDVTKLERDAHVVTELAARQNHAEKNITSLWSAHDAIITRIDDNKNLHDDKIMALRDKINGHH